MPDITLDQLVDRVHAGFSKQFRDKIAPERIREVASELDILRARPAVQTPHLKVTRLRFAGEKKLRDQEKASAIDYDQVFHDGTNVVLIPDNDVGKSSILKTIRFALTGDDSTYDVDVKSWIRSVGLEFSLGAADYAVLLARGDDDWRGLLVPRGEGHPLEVEFERAENAYVRAVGLECIQQELQRFFFQQFGLTQLAYTRQNTGPEKGRTEVRITWLTYFQALYIPDWGDRYLICDPGHATGNQDGMILSTFLGLDFVEALNALGVEYAMSNAEAQESKDRIAKGEESRADAEKQLVGLQSEIETLEKLFANRRDAAMSSTAAVSMAELRRAIGELEEELLALEQAEKRSRAEAQRARATARRFREAIDIHRHFTGIDVRVCPNCDADVAASDLTREKERHECRLCGRAAEDADAEELAAFGAEADHLDQIAAGHEDVLGQIRRRSRECSDQCEQLGKQFTRLGDETKTPMSDAFPTADEQDRYRRLLEDSGKAKAEIAAADTVGETQLLEQADTRRRILEKMRAVIKAEAARLNHQVLREFTALTESMAKAIGAESISDVSCTALGKVGLRKHNVEVGFTTINNQGERLRVKLAFFLSLMRLGTERRLGKHPGFLLIDQPGTGEMVTEDFGSLAGILRKVDTEHASHVQVICFTARPEFQEATHADKISGAKAGGFAF